MSSIPSGQPIEADDTVDKVHHVRIWPSTLSGTIRVPGDKSLSHRALMLGAMVGTEVPVSGVANSGDVAATARALRSMGVKVDLERPSDGSLSGIVLGPVREPADVVDCGNSGTSLRLLAGVAAGIAGLTVLTGDASLRRRPVDRVRAPLSEMGITTWARNDGALPPLAIVGGQPRAVEYLSPVASAQVKSCVVLAGLRADGTTTVISPAPSRDHTERMLRHLGGRVVRTIMEDGAERVEITPCELRAAPIDVPGDPSTASFWIVAAVIAATSVAITVPAVLVNTTRTGFLAVLRSMNASVEQAEARDVGGEPVADITARPSSLTGASVSGPAVVDAIDELPILALAGMVSREGLDVTDAQEMRVKESDRIRATVDALGALGVTAEERPDGYRVPGGQRPRSGVVDANGDHRIAMTAAIAATIADGPVDIMGFSTVASSYPGFLRDLRALGGRYEVIA